MFSSPPPPPSPPPSPRPRPYVSCSFHHQHLKLPSTPLPQSSPLHTIAVIITTAIITITRYHHYHKREWQTVMSPQSSPLPSPSDTIRPIQQPLCHQSLHRHKTITNITNFQRQPKSPPPTSLTTAIAIQEARSLHCNEIDKEWKIFSRRITTTTTTTLSPLTSPSPQKLSPKRYIHEYQIRDTK